MSEINLVDVYPLSKINKQKGTRRLVREKVLQLFIAQSNSDSSVDEIFPHIFNRIFNFEAGEDQISEKLLKPDEVYELEADIPLIWKEESLIFGKDLLHKALANKDFAIELIEKFAKNWDMERIANIDKALITIAVTEMLDFPDIPPKVSINEAIDIAKDYSTDKSKVFINGILDSIFYHLKKEGKLNKEGRGLK
jgi:transcription antitermination factor NusB